MRAITINGYGGVDVLALADLPLPEIEPGELLIAVVATAVNPADGKWRSGMFASFAPLPFPHVLGYDVAGIVEAGEGLAPGTRVVAMLDTFSKGGYAQYAKAKIAQVAVIPDALSFETAAAIPTAALTGLQMVEKALDLKPGQHVLITGAVGAVGHVALHAAKTRGAIVTAGVRAAQAGDARDRGADDVVIVGGEDWEGAPFDHVIDTLGGEDVARLCLHLRPGGRIITAATTTIPAEGLTTTPEFFAVAPDGADLARLVELVATGALSMPVAQVLPLEQAAQAQALVDAGGTGGKIILRP